MFYNIVIIIFLLIFAYFVYFLVDLIRTIRRTIHNAEIITERFKIEQELVHNIIFRSKDAIENIDDTIKHMENIVDFLVQMKVKWADRAHSKAKKEEINS